MRIVSNAEMKSIKEVTKSEYYFDEKLIIENVGVQGAKAIEDILSDSSLLGEMIFLVEKGSNGPQGFAIARNLSNLGYRCRAFVFSREEDCDAELALQIKMAKTYNVAVNYIDSSYQLSSYFEQVGPDVVIDCLFGGDVQLPLSHFMYEIINYINDNARVVVALDMPSGVEGDSGLVQGNAIEADVTMAIGFPKLGYYIASGPRYAGSIHILDVGLPRDLGHMGDKFLLQPSHMLNMVSPRDKFADKRIYGHSLILGGSHGLTGAPSLAARASLRVGSGLVTAATWEPQYQEMIQRLIPEVMTGYIPLDVSKWGRIIRDLNKYSSVVIGPGLARSSRSRRLVLEVLNNFDGPVVLDADAINVLDYKEDKKVFTMRNAPTVLTPHFGEFAKFAAISYEELVQSPVKLLKELVDNINCTVVLKGPCTYLGCTDGNVYFNHYPNDGMATAGVGDVLAGVLGGLLGQDSGIKEKVPLLKRYESFNRTVALSIYLHSLSGKISAQKLGVRAMSAQSLIDSFPKAFDILDEDLDKAYEGL